MENDINNILQKPAEQNGVGPVIGSVIVIMVVIAGGFYFWGSKITKDRQSADIQNQAMSASGDMNSPESDIDANELEILNKSFDEMKKDIPNL